MTEAEWLATADPRPMLEFLSGRVSDRKLWLFACGCCRRHPHLIGDVRCRIAIDIGERYANGLATPDELLEASEEAYCRRSDLTNKAVEAAAIAAAFAVIDPSRRDPNMPPTTTASAVRNTSDDLVHFVEEVVLGQGDQEQLDFARHKAVSAERAAHADLLRDIFGNPFRTVTISSSWQTLKVVALAQTIYDERAFDRLPELADVLVPAGCDNQDILNHCRSEGPHVRGCWAVDLVLGKK
jgi:hypothetical protein